MRTARVRRWQWMIVGAFVVLGAASVWGVPVSPSIEDTGTSVGIGTTTPTPGFRLDVFNGQINNSRNDGLAGGFGTQQRATFTSPRVVFNLFADAADNTGVVRSIAQMRLDQNGPFSGQIVFGTNAGGGMTDKLMITAGGVGIGTASPAGALDIQSNTNSKAGGLWLGKPAASSGYLSVRDNLFIHAGAGSDTVAGLVDITDHTDSTKIRLHTNGNTYFNGGNVGIGTTGPSARLHVAGDIQVDGNVAARYQDVAEWVRAPRPLASGTVVAIDPTAPNGVVEVTRPYDSTVAGVVSDRPGLLLGEMADSKVKVAHSGRVRVKVDASYGPIAIGDLLVTSATPGHAMRSTPVDIGETPIHRPGTLLGKALEPLGEGQGEILVLLTLQ